MFGRRAAKTLSFFLKKKKEGGQKGISEKVRLDFKKSLLIPKMTPSKIIYLVFKKQ